MAAATLAILLRAQTQVDLETGLALESAAYSTLQAGPEFAMWRTTAPHSPDTHTGEVVTCERRDDTLVISLNRPHRHNAISTQLRDELDAVLAIAEADSSIAHVILRGEGQSFCSGGDLGEFGQRPDVTTAHMARLSRSPARRMHTLRARTTVKIHGATMGGGIELAAFADNVIAHRDTRIALPEIGIGLIPGAGGTASITKRIGRQRTAALGLTGRIIDASTALSWGLVDEIAD
jgi:enoyl-CoA hydratase/carnithine racemase